MSDFRSKTAERTHIYKDFLFYHLFVCLFSKSPSTVFSHYHWALMFFFQYALWTGDEYGWMLAQWKHFWNRNVFSSIRTGSESWWVVPSHRKKMLCINVPHLRARVFWSLLGMMKIQQKKTIFGYKFYHFIIALGRIWPLQRQINTWQWSLYIQLSYQILSGNMLTTIDYLLFHDNRQH